MELSALEQEASVPAAGVIPTCRTGGALLVWGDRRNGPSQPGCWLGPGALHIWRKPLFLLDHNPTAIQARVAPPPTSLPGPFLYPQTLVLPATTALGADGGQTRPP